MQGGAPRRQHYSSSTAGPSRWGGASQPALLRASCPARPPPVSAPQQPCVSLLPPAGDDVKPFFVDQQLLSAASRKPEDLEDPASPLGAEAVQRQRQLGAPGDWAGAGLGAAAPAGVYCALPWCNAALCAPTNMLCAPSPARPPPAADEAGAIPHRLVKQRAVNWWGLTVYIFFIAAFCFYIYARAAYTLGLGPMLWWARGGGRG